MKAKILLAGLCLVLVSGCTYFEERALNNHVSHTKIAYLPDEGSYKLYGPSSEKYTSTSYGLPPHDIVKSPASLFESIDLLPADYVWSYKYNMEIFSGYTYKEGTVYKQPDGRRDRFTDESYVVLGISIQAKDIPNNLLEETDNEITPEDIYLRGEKLDVDIDRDVKCEPVEGLGSFLLKNVGVESRCGVHEVILIGTSLGDIKSARQSTDPGVFTPDALGFDGKKGGALRIRFEVSGIYVDGVFEVLKNKGLYQAS